MVACMLARRMFAMKLYRMPCSTSENCPAYNGAGLVPDATRTCICIVKCRRHNTCRVAITRCVWYNQTQRHCAASTRESGHPARFSPKMINSRSVCWHHLFLEQCHHQNVMRSVTWRHVTTPSPCCLNILRLAYSSAVASGSGRVWNAADSSMDCVVLTV